MDTLKGNLKPWNMARTAIIFETEREDPCVAIPEVELRVVFAVFGKRMRVQLDGWIQRGTKANPREVYITSGNVLEPLQQHALELLNGRDIPLCNGKVNIAVEDKEGIREGIPFEGRVLGYEQRSPSDDEYKEMLSEYKKNPSKFVGEEESS